MRALDVRGPYRGNTGYGRLTRELVRALRRRGVRVGLRELDVEGQVRPRAPQAEPDLGGLPSTVDADTVLHVDMPIQAAPVTDRWNVNFTMFEADRIPPAWVEHDLRHDRVVVPTESSRRAWAASGYPEERVALCPLGVDSDLFRPDVEPLPLQGPRGRRVSEYRTRFLNVSDTVPRKNTLGLMRTWLRATTAADDAILILKIDSGFPKTLARFLHRLGRVEREVGIPADRAAPVLLLVDRVFSQAEMPRLYAAATHYVSLSCGEGWDLPMTEAAACGLELVAPDHTAYRTYLDDSVAHLLPVRKIAVEFEWYDQPWLLRLLRGDGLRDLFRGASWWKPIEDAAVERLRYLIDDPDASRLGGGRERVASYSWDRTAETLSRLIDELTGPRGRATRFDRCPDS